MNRYILLAAILLLGHSGRAAVPQDGVPILDTARALPLPVEQSEEIAINHPEFQHALRLASSTRGAENKWATQVRWLTQKPVKAGDVLLIVFSMRCVESQAVDGKATAWFAFGTAAPPHQNTYVSQVKVDQEWKKLQFAFVSKLDHQPGQGRLSFGCGMDVQKLEIAGVEVLNFGPEKRVTDFQTSAGYRGMDENAPWREQCLARIEQVRKSRLEIHVVDKLGQPLADAEVHVAMKRHAFRFGCTFNPQIYSLESRMPRDVETYQRRFREYFNLATPEAVMNWRSWEDPQQRDNLAKALDWLSEQGIPVIGHPLVWQAPKTLPTRIQQLVKDKDYPAYIRAWDAHLVDKVQAVRGQMSQYYVINEFVDTNFLPEELTDEAMVNWYRMVQALDPKARLGILDHRMIGYGAVDAERNLPWYEKKIAMLLQNGVPLQIIAFQCHFHEVLTDPQDVLNTLDRFGKFGLELQVAEFDVDTDNEDLQGRYLRDFFIAVFSHPSVGALQQWGFYEPSHWRPRAALFRKDWSAKPNGRAFLDLVFKQWWTDQKGITDGGGRYVLRAFHGDYEVTVRGKGRVRHEAFALPKQGHVARIVLE
ncbi:MAG: endo-1,4-beta-xylanase [Patescibacteria group bacterium]|nr:endo-1,4-beta-xylanase [Patescibacteria group bacterium]